MNAVASGGRRLHFFGHISFERDGVSVALSLPPKGLTLLALIAAHHDRPISREWLAQRLWPDDDISAGRANLRRHLHLITKIIGEDALAVTRQTVQWEQRAGICVDLIEFDRLAASKPLEAAAFYRGELAAGVSDEAILDERSMYSERYAAALRALRERAHAARDDDQLLLALQYAVAHDRLDEPAVRELMSVRYRLGDRAGALREFTALQTRLHTELDVEPEAETIALYESILTSGARAETPTNLPAPAATFVGREHELQELASAVRWNQLVTLTGAGGIGKTRLAMQAATNQLQHFTGGVWFADLVQAQSTPDIYRAVAAACGVPAQGGDTAAGLHSVFAGSPTLIVLDNCEHILQAARDAAAALIAEKGVHVLATSRRRLDAESEVVVKLEPLPLPAPGASPGELRRNPAIRLFLDRAVRVQPHLRLQHENAHSFAEIVRRLDGLPLALELVGSRANLLTIEGIAKRLSDSRRSFRSRSDNARHQTVENATAWSVDLLSESERRVLELCSVFSGGWTLEALEAVIGDGSDGFEEVSELVESSLVQTTAKGASIRYSLLETTRAFASEALAASGDAQRARSAHAHYFASMVDHIAPFAEGAREAEYYPVIDIEFANVRAALTFALENEIALAAELVAGLYRYWLMRGLLPEGWSVAQRIAANTALDGLSPHIKARFFHAHGILAREWGDNAVATGSLERARALFEAAGNERGLTDVLWAQAKIAFHIGNFEEAREMYRRCVTLLERFGDWHTRAAAIGNVASLSQTIGDLDDAEHMYQLALQECKRLGYLRGLAFVYRSLCIMRQYTGDVEAAIEYARQAIAISVEIGEPDREADALTSLAISLTEAGRAAEALEPAIRSLEILSRSANSQFTILALYAAARVVQLLSDYPLAARIYGACATLCVQTNFTIMDAYKDDLENYFRELRRSLAPERFAAAWTAGERMSVPQLVAAVQAFARLSANNFEAKTSLS